MITTYGHPTYRKMAVDLGKIGITVCILKIGYRRYQFIQDFDVKAERKQRRSCNNMLRKLHNENLELIQKHGSRANK